MWITLIAISVVYFSGFVVVFIGEMKAGPVTFGLALLRAFVWPIWLLTGWPSGQVQGFD